jgi:hypothetical protein
METNFGPESKQKAFRPNRNQNPRPSNRRPQGIRPPAQSRPAGGSARNNYERYLALAREAASRGESIEAENFYQHAEHYFRVMREQG